MKFKLNESFGYDQHAINASKDIIDELDAFIDNLPDYEHAENFISNEDIIKIKEVREIFSTFNREYRKFAKMQLKNYYDKKKDIQNA